VSLARADGIYLEDVEGRRHPPLTISRVELDRALGIIDDSLAGVEAT
jgi:4-aminobutyrate aminotransferase-like enzyme